MTRVTLCVDALQPQLTGIGRYTWELYKGLNDRPSVVVDCFASGQYIRDPACLLRDSELKRESKLRRWIDKRKLRDSLVHGPNYFLPLAVETGIITVHDLSVFRFPDTHPLSRVRAFERDFWTSLSRASHVITDTQTVRAELMETYGLADDAVTAVPLGVEPVFRPRAGPELREKLDQFGLRPRAYGLCVSTLEPRKKIGELLTAWRALPTTLRDAYPLVLCGGAGWRNDELIEQVRQGVAENWLLHLGFVEESLLPAIYAGAALFIYPSTYEGFGLPPLEAMASGIPVVTAGRSCLPEVCGDAARYVDPDDPSAFVEALESSLTDNRWRVQAISLGLRRAQEYTWSRCVDETVAIYRKVEGI